MVCGGFHYGEEGQQNALFFVTPEGEISETVYAKRHLVPFGEYVPMRALVEFLVPPLADIGMLSHDLDEGEDTALYDTGFGVAGSLICFDSIYEQLTLESVRDGATFLCLATNDSWFWILRRSICTTARPRFAPSNRDAISCARRIPAFRASSRLMGA